MRILIALRPVMMILVFPLGAVGATFLTPQYCYAGAVEVQALPKEADDAADTIGRGLASQADAQLQAELAKYRRENIFGITGDLIPSGNVTFQRAGSCTSDGRQGVVFEFKVFAHMKVDVGTRKLGVKLIRKVFGVTTEQTIQVVVLPKQKSDGTIVVEIQPSITSSSAVAERSATQGDADNFRDRVSNALREKLAAVTGEYDVKALLDRHK